MCDTAKLRGKIIEKGLNQTTLAKKVGIDRSTLNRKLKDGGTFTIEEANKIAIALGISGNEAISIFFAEVVA
ncbi:MAG: helix-turn-helix transcriptional regulator [Lachnospiraceae bacterium]|nr:helix-turn-helix transcriptional regulator [Lachnospiraceae bacterium]